MKNYSVRNDHAHDVPNERIVAEAAYGRTADLEMLVTQANMALALLNAAKLAVQKIEREYCNVDGATAVLDEVIALAEKNCP